MSRPPTMSMEDATSGTESYDTSLNIRKGKESEVSTFSKARVSPLPSREGNASSETDVEYPDTNIQVSLKLLRVLNRI